ncbi:unnamed protein product [Cochlearia groenlandica]
MKQRRKQEEKMLFEISGMSFKLTVLIATCFVLCSVLLLPSSNIFNRHKSGHTTTGGLLATGFDEESCLSRYHQSSLRKPLKYKPSGYLVSKLRSYELLHKRCGPGTDSYKRAIKQLGHKHENRSRTADECRYIVWVPNAGLGNGIISLVSAFLYALLTERVILVDNLKGIRDLFCEPFPDTSWLLPPEFPLMNQTDRFDRGHSHCYGTMLENHVINSTTIPSYLYLHLVHDYSDQDKMFFCEEDQTLIRKVPWLIVKSNLYFVPSLWLIPSFQTELIKIFPQKDTVFHHLSRYLLHPTNQVWGMVTRSYNAYLSRADEILGIQIRIPDTSLGYLQHFMDQILSCTQREKLLPELAAKEESQLTNTSSSQKLKAVLVTSLRPEYSENLKRMFWEQPSSTGEIIKVYQPSGEMHQQTGKKLHEQKALAEIYLLSLADNIVTSARSTFGYVAHSIGGLKPWLLYQPNNHKAPDKPPCVRAMSMEPCFHRPPLYGCQAQTFKITPFVMPCEDWNIGRKLFDTH